MSYLSDYDLIFTTDNDLHKKMMRSVDISARSVLVEDPATPNHPARLQWAEYMRLAPENSQREAHRGMSYFLDDPQLAADGNLAEDSLCLAVAAANIDNLAKGGYV